MSARRAYVVAMEGEIPPGGRKIVTVERREIGVFNVDGEYFALRNRCPHQGAALCTGKVLPVLRSERPGDYRLDGRRLLQCPWHGWEFDMRTGQSWCEPEKVRTRSYHVRLEEPQPQGSGGGAGAEGGSGLVEGPHRAEAYEVSVKRRQIVVEIDS